jgi:hypothetical protein
VKQNDDLMSATRYALMMLREAKPRRKPEATQGHKHAGFAAPGGGWMR